MPKEITRNEGFQRKILNGAYKLTRAVSVTLGPKGRCALIQKPPAPPLATNDGWAIAKEIGFEDKIENMGAQLIKEAASRTKDLAGDGATTAIVLAYSIIRGGYKMLAAGADPMELKKGIQGAAQVAAAGIKKLSEKIETRDDIVRAASLSSGDEDIGRLVAEAIEKVGPDGVITVDESKTMETTLRIAEGMQYEKGFVSANLMKDKEALSEELYDPYILVTDCKLTSARELVPVLELLVETGRPLLIIADSVEKDALALLAVNKMNGLLNALAVHPPAYGNGRIARMEDIAAFTGGVFISQDMGRDIRETTIDMLGSARRVIVDRSRTVIIEGAGGKSDVDARVNAIKTLIKKSDYDFEKRQLEERLAKLAGGTADIAVGAATEAGMKEKKSRVEDALHAARAAVSEGVVPGGGLVYINILPAVNAYIKTLSGDMKTGAEALRGALKEPARQIAENAGFEGDAVVADTLKQPAGVGFDAMSGKYVDLALAGIIDPAKVARLALQSAASVSAILLTAGAGVTAAGKTEV
ncbi:MAG: chaperonin GroEL [Clostridiales Family XIII bacterium]|jgi:chaperonin GroEL|nr:chaperonin GroEL [Clostridiales Family XIII bacterium]